MLGRPEVRTLLYERLRQGPRWELVVARVLRLVWRGQVSLSFSCPSIGPGLYVAHGFSTIVVAESIGRDCLISQQVTVGWTDAGGCPRIGDRVRIGAGAIVIGPIEIGDDAVIGAGAVVVRDVAAGVVVGGVPAKVIEGAVDRFRAERDEHEDAQA